MVLFKYHYLKANAKKMLKDIEQPPYLRGDFLKLIIEFWLMSIHK